MSRRVWPLALMMTTKYYCRLRTRNFYIYGKCKSYHVGMHNYIVFNISIEPNNNFFLNFHRFIVINTFIFLYNSKLNLQY